MGSSSSRTFRTVQQQPRQRQPGTLPAGQRTSGPVGLNMRQAQPSERGRDAGVGLPDVQAFGQVNGLGVRLLVVGVGRGLQVFGDLTFGGDGGLQRLADGVLGGDGGLQRLADGVLGGEGRLLVQQTDPGGMGRGADLYDPGGGRRRRQGAVDGVQQRGLSGAVLTDQTDALTRCDSEVEVGEDRCPGDLDGQAVDLQWCVRVGGGAVCGTTGTVGGTGFRTGGRDGKRSRHEQLPKDGGGCPAGRSGNEPRAQDGSHVYFRMVSTLAQVWCHLRGSDPITQDPVVQDPVVQGAATPGTRVHRCRGVRVRFVG